MKQKDTIALFNYGGGMRGLVPAHIMNQIEIETGLRMAEMVDVFTGPSTGAILNTALNIPHPDKPDRPKYRARHMIRFYEREGLNIFTPDRFRSFRGMLHDINNRTFKSHKLKTLFRHSHYRVGHLHKCLRDLFGEAYLSDTLRNLVIPVYNLDSSATPESRSGGHAVWFKNVDLGGMPSKTPKVKLVDAVLASCAAPTYFPCHSFEAEFPDERGKKAITGIDGSLFDNPPISYYGAIKRHVPESQNLVMIMLGTGHTLRSFSSDHWNSMGGLGVVDPAHDLPLINALFHASETALVDAFYDEMHEDAYLFNKSIYSLEDHIRPSKALDDASPENIKKLEFFAMEMMEEHKKQFENVCHLLVNNRDKKFADAKEEAKDKKAPTKSIFSIFKD